MKLGLIGSEKRSEVIKEIIDEYYPNIHPIKINIDISNNISNWERNIVDAEKNVEAFLFTGKTIYDMISNKISFHLPLFYIPRDNNPLLMALIQAILIEKNTKYKFTVDYYFQSTVDEIIKNILFVNPELSIEIITCPYNVNTKEDLEKVKNFHMYHYFRNNITCCITGMSSVEHYLKNNGVKVLSLKPSKYIIRHTINNFMLSLEMKVRSKNLLACIYLEIDVINRFSSLNTNEYDFMLQKTIISKEVYLFSDRISGTVIENGNMGYYIFSTKDSIELITDNYKYITLIDNIYKNTDCTVSVGIGYGETVKDAKMNSIDCFKKAIHAGGDKAYFKYNDKIIGYYISPIYNDNDFIIDKKIYKITNISGLSSTTITKIFKIVEQHGTNQFTTNELADLMNLTPRTVNRILTKLMDSGLAKIVGKKTVSNVGRPTRIIELMF